MNYKFFLLIFFLLSCTSNNINKIKDTSDNINKNKDIIYKGSFSNKGFALVYDDSLKKKKNYY